jgi:hypothetical protein
MKSILVCAPLLCLVACASTPPAPNASANHDPASNNNQTSQKIGDAITSPLSDLNLIQNAIPQVLLDAQNAPYAPVTPMTCASIAAAVVALDDALGPDLDAPGHEQSWSEKGSGAVEKAGVSALRHTTEGILPFRGLIRKITGAERYSEKVAQSVAAGIVRRAFLKGVGQVNHCAAPAAPRPAPVAPVTPVTPVTPVAPANADGKTAPKS